MWFISVIIPCALEKNMYPEVAGYSALYIFVGSSSLIMLFRSFISTEFLPVFSFSN